MFKTQVTTVVSFNSHSHSPDIMAQRAASDIVRCRYCDKEYRARGIVSHERSCRSPRIRPDHTESEEVNIIVQRNERAGSLLADSHVLLF